MRHRSKGSGKGNITFRDGILLLLTIGTVFLYFGCSPGKGNTQLTGNQAVPVTVAQVVSMEVPLQLQAIGRMEAYATVSVKSMVGGELLKVHFVEGQKVSKGSLLFEIDPRPFEADLRRNQANLAKDNAALIEAKANLSRDKAQAENASVERHRYDQLVEKGVATKEQADEMKTNAAALAAGVHADQAAIDSAAEAIRADHAAVDQAQIQLGYCKIYSPIDGRAGALMVDQGNIVKANDIPMVVINQIKPIYADFAIPEQYMPEIRQYMSTGRIKVEVVPQNEAPSTGALTFIDNAVDVATGTIKLKATFQNDRERLWPGQFVSVVLTLSSQPNAIVVPNEAIQSGQEGAYVYVVKPDLTVESRPVKQGRVVGSVTVVEEGLHPGDRVVTDGQLRLVSGAKIQIKEPLEIKQENGS
jgi:multidrug efflux system membrane fusion protein